MQYVTASDRSMITTFRYDKRLGMYLPTSPKHHISGSQLELDEEATDLPRDVAGQKFLKLKGKNLYVPESVVSRK